MYSLILFLCYILQHTSAQILQNRNINTPNFNLARNTVSANSRNLPINGGLSNNLLQLNPKLANIGQRNGFNANLGYNNVASPNLVEANIANINIANGFNINAGKFTPPKNPVLAEALLRQNGGVKILAEALQVSGSVNVNGKYPISANVAINGRLPSDGTATAVW